MKELFESVAARAAGGWQHAGSKFDFEVFALPGGSFIAVALWCWTLAMMMMKSSHEQHSVQGLTLDAEVEESIDADAPAPTSPKTSAVPGVLVATPRADCTWRGVRCT